MDRLLLSSVSSFRSPCLSAGLMLLFSKTVWAFLCPRSSLAQSSPPQVPRFPPALSSKLGHGPVACHSEVPCAVPPAEAAPQWVVALCWASVTWPWGAVGGLGPPPASELHVSGQGPTWGCLPSAPHCGHCGFWRFCLCQELLHP